MAKDYGTICVMCNGLIARAGAIYRYSKGEEVPRPCSCPDEEIEKDIEEAIKEVREARALLATMREEMIEEYADYAKQEIRFCPYCGAALGIV